MVANLNTAVIYHGILTLENVGPAVNYYGIFITLAPGAKKYNLLVALSIYLGGGKGGLPLPLFFSILFSLKPIFVPSSPFHFLLPGLSQYLLL